MCDYSLHAVASRPAKVGDKLVQASEGFDSIAPGRFSEDPLGSRLGGNESLFFAHLY
jgi:hypothetical protein